nr:MAG TPA: DNA-packaging protein small subunit [Bacteriophage sp.]
MTFQKGLIPHNKDKFGKDGYTHRGRVAKNYIMKKIDAELEERGMKEISKTKGGEQLKLAQKDKELNAAVSAVLSNYLELLDKKPIQTPEECADRLNKFFEKCAEKGQLATIESMALELGLTNQQVNNLINDKSKGEVVALMLQKAKQIIAAQDAELAMRNRINSILYIFRSKNFYGMVDKREIINNRPENELDKKSKAELEDRYADIIDIDSENEE